ncbi:MAG: hypothetical protein MUD06_03315 [Rhodospirillales bacterium]|jgi:hypothetical protein|nr:hypothetical protein [Rhodospirillales bacterium]
MYGIVRFMGLTTSIMLGIGGFMLIELFAAAYLGVIEALVGQVDDPRLVFAGGLLLGFFLVVRGLDTLFRWFGRGA